MAAGSQGCNPNCADFPVAASNAPHVKREASTLDMCIWLNIASKFHVDEVAIINPAARSIPISPRRL